jgi:hypothetical protein
VSKPATNTANLRSIVIWMGALLTIACNARADIIFSNLGAGGTYNSSAGQGARGSSFDGGGAYLATAEAFTPSGNVSVGEIDIALSVYEGFPDTSDDVIVSLETSSAGLPDSVLESWDVSGLPGFGGTDSILQNLFPTSTLVLTGGDQYWLVATPGATNTGVAWNASTNPVAGEITLVDEGSGFFPNTPPAAFDVLGTAVPEPRTLPFLIAALALLAGCARRFARGRVSDV